MTALRSVLFMLIYITTTPIPPLCRIFMLKSFGKGRRFEYLYLEVLQPDLRLDVTVTICMDVCVKASELDCEACDIPNVGRLKILKIPWTWNGDLRILVCRSTGNFEADCVLQKLRRFVRLPMAVVRLSWWAWQVHKTCDIVMSIVVRNMRVGFGVLIVALWDLVVLHNNLQSLMVCSSGLVMLRILQIIFDGNERSDFLGILQNFLYGNGHFNFWEFWKNFFSETAISKLGILKSKIFRKF